MTKICGVLQSCILGTSLRMLLNDYWTIIFENIVQMGLSRNVGPGEHVAIERCLWLVPGMIVDNLLENCRLFDPAACMQATVAHVTWR